MVGGGGGLTQHDWGNRNTFTWGFKNLWFGTTEDVDRKLMTHDRVVLIPIRVLSQKNLLTETTFQKTLVPLWDKN